ncbi:MAG: ribonuclease J, partial [Clostridia bacterium]|nr:ribonuclease J [Clostridia bacterium]
MKITFLGGLNEIGKNITMLEYGDDAILIDCGMSFPDEDMPGVDIVIADFTWVEKNKERIRGIVVTHGHEDHIGGLPYLLKQVNLPIYAAKLTLALIHSKLQEHGLANKAQLHEVKAGTVIPFGAISVEFIPVNHSIPDAMALAVKTPLGYVVHTGDFKIDCTPISGEMIDLTRFGELGKEGVLALMADSTNAERPGYTPSERTVGDSFATLFPRAEGKRLIIATFSSNLHRIQQIIDAADRDGRKVAISGRSMLNYVSIAVELGYLRCPEGLMIDIDVINRYPKDRVTLITTGSQGEPMSALSRMAFSDHRKVEVGPEDYIIISANPIPGNEKTVGRVVDELLKRGCEVVYERMYDVHVSGHACREELKIIQGLTRPQYFIPVHGEQKHLQKHAELAYAMGMDQSHVLIADVGKVVELTADKMAVTGTVPAGRVLVDGLGVGDVGSIVLRDRRHLAEDGLIVVVATIDRISEQVVSGPDIGSRGFVYVRESETLIDDAREIAYRVLDDCCREGAD